MAPVGYKRKIIGYLTTDQPPNTLAGCLDMMRTKMIEAGSLPENLEWILEPSSKNVLRVDCIERL